MAFAVAIAGCSAETRAPNEKTGSSSQAVWTNGGLESDAIGAQPTGWTVTPNLNPGITVQTPQTYAGLNLAAGGVNETAVVGGAQESVGDPDVPAIVYPRYGVRAMRVNYPPGSNQNVNSVEQSMTAVAADVDPVDGKVHVRFTLVPILQNPSHPAAAQPYYFVQLTNVTKNTILYQDFNYAAYPGVPWKTVGAVYYTDWQLVDIAPGTATLAVGDQVDLKIIASGCAYGGHWGRVYVDGVGSQVPGLYVAATGPQSQNAGQNITYSFNYKNGGAAAAGAAVVQFVTPANTTFQSASLAGCTGLAAGAAGTETCSLGTVAAGATGAFTVTVQIAAGTASGTVITNGNYNISATNESALLGPKVNTNVTVGVAYADLSTTKTDGLTAVGWGQPLTYTVVASNAGPNAVTGVTVSDPVPAQLTGLSWTCVGANGGTCAASGAGAINDTTVGLPVNASVTYTVQATVAAGTGTGTVTNVATTSVPAGAVDPDNTNNAVGDTDAIGPSSTLTLTKNAPQTGAVSSNPGGIACGVGCATAAGTFGTGSSITLTETPAAGFTFTGWTGACASAGTAPTCTFVLAANGAVGTTFVGPPTSIAVSGGATQSAGVGQPFAAPLAVTVTDALGSPVAGAVVTYAAPGTGASASLGAATATTDASGVAILSAAANGSAGNYSVTATVAGLAPATFSLTNLGAPAAVTVAGGSSQSAGVGLAFGAPLSVVVTDSANDVLPNVTVAFAAPGGGASAALSAPTATTNAMGVASVGATANTVSGGYAVTATAQGAATSSVFALTNTAGAVASIAVAAGSGQMATVATPFATSLQALVSDSFGNPVAGATVTFAGPAPPAGAVLGAPTAVTDATGVAAVAAAASTLAGSYTVGASTPGAPNAAAFLLANVAGAPAALVATSGGAQTATVGTPLGAPLVVSVVDAFGNPVIGAVVAFGAPGSGPSAVLSSPTASTGGSGQASVTAAAGSVAGAYQVSASIGGLSATFAITNTPGAASLIAVTSGSAQSATVGAPFGAALVATVTDASGNAVPGVAVTFAAPAAGASASFGAATATTDASGKASSSATANSVSGAYVATATAVGVMPPAAFSLTNTAGAPASVAVSSGGGQSATVGTAFAAPLVAVVRDAQGNAVLNASVAFAGPSSGPSATFVGSPATTDSMGFATVTATAASKAGAFAVTASVGGVATPASFALTSTPSAAASIAVVSGDAQMAAVAQPYGSPLVAVVLDASGNPVSGVPVTFTTPASGASASASASVAITDASGNVSVRAVAGTTAGAFKVQAAAAGVSAGASFSLTNSAGAAVSLVRAPGTGTQTAQVSTAFSGPLAVTAVDAFGNQVAGVSIAFAAPTSGATATLTSASVTTDAAGHASVAATAGKTGGTYVVTASLPDGVQANFVLINLTSAPLTIVADSGTPASGVVATDFALPLAVRVRDGSGQPLANKRVTFVAPGAGATAILKASTALTDATGLAEVMATAGNLAGTYTVVARTDGAAQPASFALTNTAGSPASVIASLASSPQGARVGTAFSTPLTTTVLDAYGNPVPNVTVAFAAPPGGATAALAAPSATTDVNGQAVDAATASATPGAYVVTASATGVANAATFALTNLSAAPVTVAVKSGSGQSTGVSHAFAAPLVALVLDGSGNPVPNVTVTFAPPTTSPTASLAAATATTDAQGIAQTTPTADTKAGVYEILATAPNASAPARFSLTNAPGAPATATASSDSTPQSTKVGAPFSQPLTVAVVDAFGNAVPGVVVTYAAPATGATASVSTASPATDGSGETHVVATASTLPGEFAVSATAAGVLVAATFDLTNAVEVPSSVQVASGDGQTTTATTAFQNPIAITVRDQFGNAVPGVAITVTVPSTGSTATFSPAAPLTDVSGTATIQLTANGVPGTFVVTASVVGASAPSTANLTIRAIATTTVLAAANATAVAGTDVAFTATVKGSIGSPTGNVRFVSGGKDLGPGTLANGVATYVLATPAAGTFTVSAVYDANGAFASSTSNSVVLTVVAAGGDAGDASAADAADGSDGSDAADGSVDSGTLDAANEAGDSGVVSDSGIPGAKGSIQGGGCTCTTGPGSSTPSPDTALLVGVAIALAVARGRKGRRRVAT